MLKGAIFDMDGLMFDTEAVYTASWRRAAAEHGYELDEEKLSALRGGNAASQQIIFEQWYGKDVDFMPIKQACRDYTAEYLDTHDIPIKPGLFELFEALKQKGYIIAVATASRRAVAARWWAKAGVMDYIDTSVCGDEITLAKPSPDIFLKAAKQMKLAPEECIIFEDSFNGIKAAHASGAVTAMVPDLQQPTDEIRELCDYVFTRLDEAIKIL